MMIYLAPNGSAKVKKPCSTFLNIWNIIIVYVLIYFSTCPIISFISKFMLTDCFFSTLCFFACKVIFHWMPATVNFIFFGPGYFDIFLNVLELGSGYVEVG